MSVQKDGDLHFFSPLALSEPSLLERKLPYCEDEEAHITHYRELRFLANSQQEPEACQQSHEGAGKWIF